MNFLFDLYGTLIDIKTDEGMRAPWDVLCDGLDVERERWQELRGEYDALCQGKKRGEDHEIDLLGVFEDLLVAYGGDAEKAPALALAFRKASTLRLGVFSDVIPMLTALREAGAGVYLVSNAQACFTRREIERCGLLPLFDGIVLSSEVGVKKPSPEIFRMALERFGMDATACVYVGNDRRDDVLGATRAGLRSVYIPTEQSRTYREELPAPTYAVADHEELAALLLSLAR